MAKSTIPGIKAGGGLLGKLVGGIVVLALLVVVVKHPSDAAGWVSGLIDMGIGAVDGIAAFVRQLVG